MRIRTDTATRSHTAGRQSRRPAISHYLETHADYTARLNEAVDPGYDEPSDNDDDDDDEDDDDPADQGMAEFRQAIRAREEAEQRAAAASATLS